MQELPIYIGVNIIVLVSMIGFLYFLFRKYFNEAVGAIVNIFGETFEKPTMKRAMGILGKHSGESRAQSAVIEDAAGQVLNSEKMQGLKLGASAIGIDLDQMIEDHGAVSTLQGLTQLAGMLGIDLTNINLSGLLHGNSGSAGAIQKNPYL